MASFGDDEVWYGSVPVHLEAVPGDTINYVHSEWAPATDDASLAITKKRASRLKAPGSDVADVVVPAIPALEIVCSNPSRDVSAWPEKLRAPLLKRKEALPDEPKAVASGCRSCLVKLSGSWYRLKGSGNDDEGFVVRRNAGGWRDIRGSAFLHTAVRENFMTATTAQALGPRGIPGANISCGIYTYGEPNRPMGDGPDFEPACIVERTLGDRRFGTHVLAGLELIMPLFIDLGGGPGDEGSATATGHQEPSSVSATSAGSAGSAGSKTLLTSAILAHFPTGRPGRESVAGLNEATAAALMTDHMIAGEMGMPGHGLQWPDVPRDESTFGNFGDFLLPERAPPSSSSAGDGSSGGATWRPQQWANAGAKDMGVQWHAVWDATISELNLCLSSLQSSSSGSSGGGSSTLGYIFSRCGYDCGRFASGLHGLGISWGTYQDEMCRRDLGEWHCNAHANNMVLLQPPPEFPPAAANPSGLDPSGLDGPAFLGYLDLDMAFDDKTFVDVWAAPPPSTSSEDSAEGGAVGSGGGDARGVGIDAETHARLLKREHISFIEVLTGSDTTNGVPQIAKSTVDSHSDEIKVIQTALYDTLVLGYMAGYTGDTAKYPVQPYSPERHRAAYLVMKLAVIVMADYVA